jgi:hypothetical protein
MNANAMGLLCHGVADHGARPVADALVRRAASLDSSLAAREVPIETARDLADRHRVVVITAELIGAAAASWIPPALAQRELTEQALVRAADVITPTPLRVLKGLATGPLDHGDGARRDVGDVDVLVPADRLDVTIAKLLAAGYRPQVTHPFRSSRLFHSETLVDPTGVEIDLHRRLAHPSSTTLAMWDAGQDVVIQRRVFTALDPSWRYVHALVHQALNGETIRRLNGVLDLVRMASASTFDADAVAQAAHQLGFGHVVAVWHEHVRSITPVDVPPVPNLGGDQRVLVAALDAGRAAPLSSTLGLLAWRDRPRYVAELVWPSPQYRALLGRGVRTQAAHVAGQVADAARTLGTRR